ncbi:putative quinol monooxygenase [Labrys portucalensis]|uniref:Quinol monooxygenase n=1 Tax=Labrys neptuniae TaxID=376174 RepID=A0ABV6ZN68_9HYPH
MLIAILDFEVAPAQRSVALDQLLAEMPTVREMHGNIAFRPFADTLADTKITLVHEWEHRSDFDAYLASPCFARSGEVLRPMMTSAPISRRFEASLIEKVR